MKLKGQNHGFPSYWDVFLFSDAILDKTGGNHKVKQSDYQSFGSLAIVDQGFKIIGGYTNEIELKSKEELPVIIFGDHSKIFKYIDFQFTLGADGVKILVPVEGFDRRFVFHYLRTLRLPNNAGYSRHFKFLKEKLVPKPPLEEQKRIAAILDKADNLRRKRQQAIDLGNQFLRSVFLDMFGDPVLNPKGWEQIQLDMIADIKSGVTKGRKLEGKKLVSVPYMRVANVQDGHIDISDVKDIDVLESDVDKYALKNGDILLTEGGDPDKLGRGAVWKCEIKPCIHQNHIFSVRVKDKNQILPEYLSNLIGSARGKRYFLKVGKQTTGIATINKTVLSQFPALIPPIELQYQFIKTVKKTQTIIKKIKYSEDLNDLMFSALSQKAFQGEL